MGRDDDHDDNNSPLHHRNKYDLNSKIMLTAIISLSIVVVLVTLLQIYARCILKRQSTRRRRAAALRQLGIVITSADVHNINIEPPKAGLDPSVISSLPIFVFSTNSEMGSNNHHECSVCLSMLEDGEMARTLPNCKHTFHAECIDKWFSSQSTCPICRTEAEPRTRPRPVPETREGVSGDGAAGILPTAPPLDSVRTTEGTSSGKITRNGSNLSLSSSSRLSSFRRILSRDHRTSQGGQEDTVDHDLERQ